MLNRHHAILATLLVCAGSAPGQTTSASPDAATEFSEYQRPVLLPPCECPPINSAEGAYAPMCPCTPGGPRIWASVDGLSWWVKGTPLPVPTLTTFTPGSTSAKTGFGGALGVPGTTVLSPDHLGYNPFLGGRVSIGGWLSSDQRLGAEFSGFLLQTHTASFGTFSNAAGVPALRVPFVNVPPGVGFPLGESSFVLAEPGFANGGQMLTSSLNLWGAEGNAILKVGRDRDLDLALLAGFRYLQLHENLSIVSDETVPGAFVYSAADAFETRNQFYGGQVGVKAATQYGRFYASFVAKIAFGDNHETFTINGVSSATLPGGPPVATRGGIFAQSTNIGQRTRDEFCVVPDIQLKFGVNLTNRISAFVGYDLLYMSEVVRPGNQIDRTLNFTTNAAILGGPPGLVGAARPEPQFNGTGFWRKALTWVWQSNSKNKWRRRQDSLASGGWRAATPPHPTPPFGWG